MYEYFTSIIADYFTIDNVVGHKKDFAKQAKPTYM